MNDKVKDNSKVIIFRYFEKNSLLLHFKSLISNSQNMNKMVFLIIFLLCFSLQLSVFGQSENDEFFVVVEEMPVFPGGDEALMSYIAKNIQFPESAKAENIDGVVYASFIVEKDGQVSNPEIFRGLHPDCDAEVLRVLSEMPVWSPGKQRGNPVRVKLVVPVRFKF
jgi:TonB family protein